MNEEEVDNEIKISIPIISNQEIENIINTEDLYDKIAEQIYHDREMIILQEFIKKLQKETTKYKNMYESEHKIHLLRNEQLDRKQNAITKCNELQTENEQLRTEMNSLQKENEELKIIKSAIQTLQINSMEDEKYIVISKSSFLDGSYKHLLDDYIPVQKIKDKIERIQEEGYWLFTTDRDSNKCIEVLQELLKEGGK